VKALIHKILVNHAICVHFTSDIWIRIVKQDISLFTLLSSLFILFDRFIFMCVTRYFLSADFIMHHYFLEVFYLEVGWHITAYL
jgi:hypothetical protein